MSTIKKVQIGEGDSLGDEDVHRLLRVIETLRTVLFTPAVTIDKLIYQLSEALLSVSPACRAGFQSSPLISDYFLLSLHDFLRKYLSVLAELSPEQKEDLFKVKSRLCCALHFNYELTDVILADERRHRDNECLKSGHGQQTAIGLDTIRLADAPPLSYVCSKRVSFMHDQSTGVSDTTRVLTIESFCPSFSLYTVARLHARFDDTRNLERWLSNHDQVDDDSSREAASGKRSRRVDEDKRASRKKRSRDKYAPRDHGECDPFNKTALFQPPDHQSWYSLCLGDSGRVMNSASSSWPPQTVLQNSSNIMNDKAMRELMDRLDNDDLDSPTYKQGHHEVVTNRSLSSNHTHMTMAGDYLNRKQAGETHVFTDRHCYSGDVQTYIEAQRQHSGLDANRSDNRSFKQQYQWLLHRFSIHWAKLHFMEPQVFARGGTIRE